MHISTMAHIKKPFDRKGLFVCRIWGQNPCMIYGYARISTDGQSLDAKVKKLRARRRNLRHNVSYDVGESYSGELRIDKIGYLAVRSTIVASENSVQLTRGQQRIRA
jgi:hypothetical protein